MKILVIQTAFIGDVILATPIIEKLRQHYPNAMIDFLVQKGNHGLLDNHPHIRKVLVFDKKKAKYRNLWKLIREIRHQQYDWVINAQRFFSSGLLTVLSGAKRRSGFQKNPLSFFFTHQVKHEIGNGTHEIERNLDLIKAFTDDTIVKPKLYPKDDYPVLSDLPTNYICIAPASKWFTKQFPTKKWVKLIDYLNDVYPIYLIGGKEDIPLCEQIREESKVEKIGVLAGQLTFMESTALIKNAVMNFVNDSAPMHLASTVNAPVSAVFCSTTPDFGFGPLSNQSYIFETTAHLSCRPCGLHGRNRCPEGHFNCSDISIAKLGEVIMKK